MSLEQRHTSCRAAANGHLEVVQRVRRNGCAWTKDMCSQADKNGHLESLEWARNNGCPRDETTCSEAASGGHLDVLQLARSSECPWDESTCSQTACNGHLERLRTDILRFFNGPGRTDAPGTRTPAQTLLGTATFQWATYNGYPWDASMCEEAEGDGQLEVLQWARPKGYPWSRYDCQYAAQGHDDVSAWISIDCTYTETPDGATAWRQLPSTRGHGWMALERQEYIVASSESGVYRAFVIIMGAMFDGNISAGMVEVTGDAPHMLNTEVGIPPEDGFT
ncbi:unnamed protein product [Ectocarpus sp. CCAP 1310/34]|nr:unnamed protein product [Ectocarpus sp. CCAP 1310/34]